MADREKVIRGLEGIYRCISPINHSCGDCPYQDNHVECIRRALSDALELLKEQPEQKFFVDSDGKITPLPIQPQWISVEERLPDDASDVLAYYDDGTESRIIPVNYYKQCWYDCVFNRAIDGLETGFIKYWMSLPKAPEVKQNETD